MNQVCLQCTLRSIIIGTMTIDNSKYVSWCAVDSINSVLYTPNTHEVPTPHDLTLRAVFIVLESNETARIIVKMGARTTYVPL